MKRIVTFGLVCLFAFVCASMALPLDINTTPNNPPIVIPPAGGNISYHITVYNPNTTTVDFVVKNRVRDINPPYWYPVFSLDTSISYSLPGFGWLIDDWDQPIAATMPSGNLRLYSIVVNTVTGLVEDFSWLPFTKTNVSDGGPWISESYVTGDLSFDETSVAAPAQFALNGNYPNPFNPTTNISYSLATTGNVKLTVFDATGREVATLVNDFRDAGSHQVTFDASKLAAGVYLYQLHFGSQVASGKMVLMK